MGRRILYNVPLMLSVARFKELARVRAFNARYIAASGICKPGLVWESERERDGAPVGEGGLFLSFLCSCAYLGGVEYMMGKKERKKEIFTLPTGYQKEKERGGGFSDCPGPRSIDCTGFLFLFSFLNGLNGTGHDIITPLTHRPHPYSST